MLKISKKNTFSSDFFKDRLTDFQDNTCLETSMSMSIAKSLTNFLVTILWQIYCLSTSWFYINNSADFTSRL